MFKSNDEFFIEDTLIAHVTDVPGSEMGNGIENAFGLIADNEITQNGITSVVKSEALVKLNMDVFSSLNKPNITVTDVNFIAQGGAVDGNLLVKEINGDWEADSITYRDVYPVDGTEPAITYGDEIIDYHTGTNSSTNEDTGDFVAFNITELFNKWLCGADANNGFAIVPEKGVVGILALDGYFEITISGEPRRIYFDTYVTVDYVDTSGGNDEFEYLSQEIGRAGSAKNQSGDGSMIEP